MERKLYLPRFFAVLLAALALAACSPAAAPGLTAQPPTLVPAASAAPENTATLIPAGSPTPENPSTVISTPEGTPSAAPSEPAPVTITLANNNQSITLQVGQRFLLQLGDSNRWNVNIDNQDVVSRLVNISVVKGAQGVYEAHRTGNALLSAVGTAVCDPTQGVCSHLAIGFALQITVQ